MLKTTSTIALALLLAASPSALLAQSAQQPESPAVELSEPGSVMSGTAGQSDSGTAIGQSTAQSTAQPTAQSTATTPESEDATMAAPQKPIDGQIVLQDSGSKLANDLLGEAVYSLDGEVVGDVNDLIIDQNGSVQGVVIGVGGLLGIGEKQVAVEMAKVTMTATPDGDEGLVLNATKQDLDAAPAFKTVAQQRAEQEAAEAEEAMRLEQQKGVIDNSMSPTTAPPPE